MSIFKVRKGASDDDTDAELVAGPSTIFTLARPSDAFLGQQVVWVRNYADLRADRIPEISIQLDDIMSFFGGIALLNDRARARTAELLSIVQNVCIFVEMQVKHLCRAWRPVDFAPELYPVIQTPDHSTFPSGHSTESFAVATMLNHLMNGSVADGVRDDTLPFRQAHRIAVNRTVAGVHFPVDSAAGALLGIAIGEALFAAARAPGESTEAVTLGFAPDSSFAADQDFTLEWLQGQISAAPLPAASVPRVDFLARHFKAAQAEWV